MTSLSIAHAPVTPPPDIARRLPGREETAPEPARRLGLEVHRSFEAARGDWMRFQATAAGHPFQRYEWLHAWWEGIGRAQAIEPYIVVARDALGAVRALYPLGIRASRLGRLLVPLGGGVCDYHAPLVDPAFFAGRTRARRAELWAAIRAAAPADAALLERLLPDEHGDPYGAARLRPHPARAHALALGSEWGPFYQARRGVKSRRTLREKRSRLARRGPIRFVLAETDAERARLLALGVALKRRQLADAGYRNPYHHAQVRAFYGSLAALSPAESALRVFALAVGDQIAAVAVCLVDAERLYYLLPAYDQDRFGRFSPGQLLLCELMEWAIARGVKVFDFTIGDEPYKQAWCDVTTPLAYVAEGLTPRGRLAARALVLWLACKRTVGGHPRLRPLALGALDRLWAARQRFAARVRPAAAGGSPS